MSGKTEKSKRRRSRRDSNGMIYLRALERRRAKRVRVVTGVLLLAMIVLCLVVAFFACVPGDL